MVISMHIQKGLGIVFHFGTYVQGVSCILHPQFPPHNEHYDDIIIVHVIIPGKDGQVGHDH